MPTWKKMWNANARAEGRVHEMTWLDKLAYVGKYLFAPRLRSDAATENHFRLQRKILRALPPPRPGAVRLGLGGDLMWIRRGWTEFLSDHSLSYFRSLDGILANLESPISPSFPVNETMPDLFLFNSRPGLVRSFRGKDERSLFAALSFANNHTLDCGDQGARDTLSLLAEDRIPQSGAATSEGRPWVAFERGGIPFSFYAATFGLNEMNLLRTTAIKVNWIPGLAPDRPGSEPDLTAVKAALAEMPGTRILSLHWGHEFEYFPTDRMRAVARELVAAGADIILGAHPHTPQPADVFFVNGAERSLHLDAPAANCLQDGRLAPRKALVIYSLGNFVSAMYTVHSRVGAFWELHFSRNPEGAVDWSPHSVHLLSSENHRRGRKLRLESEVTNPRLRRHFNFLHGHLGL